MAFIYNNINKTQLWFLIGIPVLLLIISLILASKDHVNEEDAKLTNLYFKEITNNEYINIINKNKDNDSTFFCSVVDKYGIRELVVFKKFPNDSELKTDIIVKVYPAQSKLLEKKEKFLNFNIINDGAKFNYKGKTYGVFKTSLPFIDIEKLEVDKKGNNKWKALLNNPFSRLNPAITNPSRNRDSSSTSPYLFLMKKVLKHYNISYLSHSENIKNNSFIESKKLLDKYAVSEHLTTSYLENPQAFWNLINKRDKRLANKFVFNGPYKSIVEGLINKFVAGGFELELLFDINKLSTFNALQYVFTGGCEDNICFVFNKDTNLIEPFFISSSCLGEIGSPIKKPIITNNNYLNLYVPTIEKLANMNIYDIFINEDIALKNNLALENSYHPKNIFNYDILEINQRIIKKSLNISATILPELILMNKDVIVFSLYNSSPYPIDVSELVHKKNKSITKLDPIIQIKSYETDTITIELPSSFENLFVRKKTKTTGFILYKDIYDLSVRYGITGLSETYKAPIAPYVQNETVNEDLFRLKNYVNNHEKLLINEDDKKITFSEDSISISSPLIIPKGYVFSINPGSIIDILKGGKVVSYSPLDFTGTKQKPIKVYSSDKKGQGILVLSEGQESTLKFVDFDYLRNPKHGNWGVTGAVTFYESPVDLEYVSVKNNSCEDALNIVRTNFIMNHVTISSTQSDAFDGDFVKGTISNCTFDKLGNDAIDVSGSDLIIRNVIVSNAGDKGLSAGENSKMDIDNAEITNSEIAIAGKDLSIIDAKNLKFVNTKLGFTAFQKKPEFGPSQIKVKGITMTDIETKYLIESSSSLFVDGEKIETTQNVKDRMYGVEFGVSSSETRNTPQ